MPAAFFKELQGCISSLSEAASKFTSECESTISRLQKQQASTVHAQWQCQTDQGWADYREIISDMLESAQKHARSKISFRINGDVYTADLDALVQKRQAKPYTERAIRRTVATDRHIAAMV
jgi:WWE domain